MYLSSAKLAKLPQQSAVSCLPHVVSRCAVLGCIIRVVLCLCCAMFAHQRICLWKTKASLCPHALSRKGDAGYIFVSAAVLQAVQLLALRALQVFQSSRAFQVFQASRALQLLPTFEVLQALHTSVTKVTRV